MGKDSFRNTRFKEVSNFDKERFYPTYAAPGQVVRIWTRCGGIKPIFFPRLARSAMVLLIQIDFYEETIRRLAEQALEHPMQFAWLGTASVSSMKITMGSPPWIRGSNMKNNTDVR